MKLRCERGRYSLSLYIYIYCPSDGVHGCEAGEGRRTDYFPSGANCFVCERIITLLGVGLRGEMQHRAEMNRGDHKAVRRKGNENPRGQKLTNKEWCIGCSLTDGWHFALVVSALRFKPQTELVQSNELKIPPRYNRSVYISGAAIGENRVAARCTHDVWISRYNP